MISQTPSPGNRNAEWAVDLFRPLLKKLHVQNVQEKPTIVTTLNDRNFIIKGMGRFIIGIQKQSLADGQKGYCVFIYKEEVNLYILSIVIDDSFFLNDTHKLRVQRKELAIHEFVHCAAIMMSTSLLGSGPNPLIERLKQILQDKLSVTTTDDFNQLFAALGTIAQKKNYQKIGPLSDKHFRTGFEDFPDDYAELYLNFLFSYKLLKEVINSERVETFKSLMLSKSSERLISFLQEILEEISDTKALEQEFVLDRIVQFLPRLAKELQQVE